MPASVSSQQRQVRFIKRDTDYACIKDIDFDFFSIKRWLMLCFPRNNYKFNVTKLFEIQSKFINRPLFDGIVFDDGLLELMAKFGGNYASMKR